MVDNRLEDSGNHMARVVAVHPLVDKTDMEEVLVHFDSKNRSVIEK